MNFNNKYHIYDSIHLPWIHRKKSQKLFGRWQKWFGYLMSSSDIMELEMPRTTRNKHNQRRNEKNMVPTIFQIWLYRKRHNGIGSKIQINETRFFNFIFLSVLTQWYHYIIGTVQCSRKRFTLIGGIRRKRSFGGLDGH